MAGFKTHKFEHNSFHIFIGHPFWLPSEVDEMWHPPIFGRIFTQERGLANILVAQGWFESTSEVKRNRKDLFHKFPDDHSEFIETPAGKMWGFAPRNVLLIVGPAVPEKVSVIRSFRRRH